MRENKSYKVSQIRDQASLKSNSNKKSKIINNSLIISRCQRRNLFSLLTSRESTSSSYKTIEFFQVAISWKIKKRRSSQKSSRMREAPIALIVIATIIKYKRRSKRYHSRLSSRRKPRSSNSRKIALKINNPTEDRLWVMMNKKKKKSHQKFQMVHTGNSQRAKLASKWTAYRHNSHGKYDTRITTCGSKL